MISAVLLAAGSSRRFGSPNKLVAPIAGKPMLLHIARAARSGGAGDIVVVTGAFPDEVRGALAAEDVRFVHCERWGEGMGISIAVGIAALSPACQGAFVLLGDMPRVRASEIAGLISAFHDAGGERVVVPVDRNGGQRNPVLWPRRFFPELGALRGDRGAKALLAALAPRDRRDVVFDDAGIFADVDTTQDLARLEESFGG